MTRLMNVVALSFFILSVSLASFGCAQTDDEGGPGSSSDADAGIGRDLLDSTPPTPDATADTGSDADTTIEPDLPEPDLQEEPDVQEEPDLPPPVCGGLGEPCCDGYECDDELTCDDDSFCVVESGCPEDPACFDPPYVGDYPGDLPILMREGYQPTLGGGTLVDGDYELTLIEMYADATFSELVTTVEISDNGTSYGSLAFLGPDWSFGAYLDLYIYLVALGMEFPQSFQTALDAGGCYVATGNRLESDITECGGVWPEGSDPPSYLEYEASTDTVKFLLILTNETILAAIPEADRDLAAIAITGDLPIVFTFDSID